MNKLFKQFVAFAIVAVMLIGMIPMSASAAEHDHDHGVQTSDIAPFSSTADLIEQVKAQLVKDGKLYNEQQEDEKLIASVESKSEYTFAEAKTMLGLGFFNNRTGAEGEIGTAHLNLSKTELIALVENVLTSLNMTGIVQYEIVVEDGVASSVAFTLRESFAAGLDDMEASSPAVSSTEDIEEETVITGSTAVVMPQVTTEKVFPFTDVPESHWARTAINYLYQRDIVSGTTKTTFGPNVKVSRAMAVTILYRVAGSPAHSGKNTFTDVKAGQWYTDAIIWASENNIVNGVGNGKFGPDNNLTREQLVTFMYRYAAFDGKDVSARADLTAVKDAKQISSWAKDAVQWAIAEGVIKGYTDGTVRPAGTATRAEFAQVVYNYMIKAHQLTHVAATTATCVTEGNIEYWVCSKCGKYFADEKATKEITKADTVIAKDPTAHNPVPVAEVSPTCTETGVAAHYKCVCGLTLDAQGNLVTDASALILPAIGHKPAVDENGNYVNAVFNWSEPNGIIVDAQGNVTFDPNVYFVDANGNPILENNAPVNVGWTLNDMAISSISLVYMQNAQGQYEIQMMPTIKPDYWYDWNDVNGDGTMDAEEVAGSKINHRDTYVCDTVTFTCSGCKAEFTKEVQLSNYIMTEEWIDQAVNDYATEIAMGLIEQYVAEKAMAYYGQTGAAPSDEMINGWVAEAQADPAINGQITQAATAKALELYQDMGSVIYVAECAGSDIAAFSDSVNATKAQLQKSWATMCKFNEDYSKYFGLVAPYWESKNTETSPLGAVIYMCSMEEMDLVPNVYLDMMVSMLTQAFMSYVYSYAPMLDAMLADAMATVNYKSLDDIDKLLLLHDWLAENATFDMQGLVDITSGVSAGSDPISMTAFGLLLNDQIQKTPGAMWDGGVCLAYAAAYAMLIQQAFGMTQEDEAIVDFAKIQYLTNVAESSVAAGDSGFGDGDAMFNSAHYMNAVRLGDTWYYIDACYDDVNVEVISQQRVETDGNVSHNSFLVAPSSWEEMYEDNFQYMDSLYDGKVWQRVYDGESGYYKMDGDRNIYTAAEAAAMEEADPNIQLFYYYESTATTAEQRYEDDTYETAWFVSANSAINYDDASGYFYYTSGSVTSYASMKDLFGDSEDGSGNDLNMDSDDMATYKGDPSAQDKIVRRPVNAKNEPEETDDENQYSMVLNNDPYAEVLFHFGYGSTGSTAHEQYTADGNNESYDGMGSIEESEKGPYYALVEDDADYYNYYPDLTHSTVVMDGKLYFNMGNAIYTFNATISELARKEITNIKDLELVKVKEYNDVTYTSNGKRFTGMSFVTSETGTTVRYHPIAALNVHDARTWEYDAYGTPTSRTAEPTLYVSIATNLSNSYKTQVTENGETVEKAYVEEARNFNPNYYRFMDTEEEETEEETNSNTEFMWTANIVDTMPVDAMLEDLARGSSRTVTVEPYCARDGFTESRTTKYGLTVSNDRVVDEGSALDHQYAMDAKEGTNICDVCLKNHDHDYDYATSSDIDIVWTVSEDQTKLTAEAFIYCGNDKFCNVDQKVDCTVKDNGDGSFTATATYNRLTKTETKTVDQVLHKVHDYGDPVFNWTQVEETVNGQTVTTWAVEAVFTCEADEEDCKNSEAEGTRDIKIACEVTDKSGEVVATVTGPEGTTFTDALHTFSNEKDEQGNYEYVTITMNEGKDTFTAVYTCTVCGEEYTITGTVVKTVQGSDCESAGSITYTATASAAAVLSGFEDKTYAEAPEAVLTDVETTAELGHDYDYANAQDVWNADHTECTVTAYCKREGCTAEPNVLKMVAGRDEITWTGTEATCTTDGTKEYKAVLYVDNVKVGEYFDTVVTPATGHAYGEEPVVTWTYVSETEMTVDVRFICANGCGIDDVMEMTTPVETNGKWTSTYVYNGTNKSVEHTHDYSTTGACVCGKGHTHTWGAATYTWNEDKSKCTATRTCSEATCPVKTETETVNVTPVVVAATCTTAGSTTYTATFTATWAEEQEIVDPIAALGHDFATAWTTNETNHWHACSRCEVKDSDGTHDFGTAGDTCTVCNYQRDHVHRTSEVAAKAATCTEAGNTKYYTCSGCDKYFSDAAATQEITDKTSVVIPASHTYGTLVAAKAEVHTPEKLEPAVAAHYQCSACEKYFTEGKVETTLAALTGTTPVHTYADTWTTDAENHWHACACGAKKDNAAHVYTDDTDATCNTCNYERTPPHTHDFKGTANDVVWTYDNTTRKMSATMIWKCSGCDATDTEIGVQAEESESSWTFNFANHAASVMGVEFTHTHNVNADCSVCGYKHVHNYADATCTAPKTCACGATEGEALGHDFTAGEETCANCTEPNPNYVDLDPMNHEFVANDEAEGAGKKDLCKTCGEHEALHHVFEAKSADKKDDCLHCKHKIEKHHYFEPSADDANKCANCGKNKGGHPEKP